ncbi:MAG: ATP-binding cassette domain-containing protein [Micromonosporaceae bacterium]|nr:ATP-binding cassette domain-containing protein [Micromonosporaceae bacterium]
MRGVDVAGAAEVTDATESGDRTAIRVSGVSKSFGSTAVLTDLDLVVGMREKVALIGPSGSGKTTVLRVLAGLERPDGGEVALFGSTVWPRPPKAVYRRVMLDVGMVFQQFNLFPHMTALRNVMEGPMRAKGWSRGAAAEKAREVLDMVGMSGYEKSWPAQLSGGQQQRVAIARTLAMEPRLLLLDEVTSALDPELVGEVLAVIRRLSTDTDLTILMVTHEMTFAARSADRVLMFDSGVVVENGPAQEVLRNPGHERTRRFLSAVLER